MSVKIFAIAGALLASCGAYATPYYEVGDAGESLTTAQALGTGVDRIYGSYARYSSDMYSFNWEGGAFSVDTFDTVPSVGQSFDTMLFLFNAFGQGVRAADGSSCCGVAAAQLIDPALAAGVYYLAISPFGYEPRLASDALMFTFSSYIDRLPVDDSILDHWGPAHSNTALDYVITFHTPVSVPEPATVSLFGVALMGLFVRRKHKSQSN